MRRHGFSAILFIAARAHFYWAKRQILFKVPAVRTFRHPQGGWIHLEHLIQRIQFRHRTASQRLVPTFTPG